jgi:hypothetical protein
MHTNKTNIPVQQIIYIGKQYRTTHQTSPVKAGAILHK